MAAKMRVLTRKPGNKMMARIKQPSFTEVREVGHYSTDGAGKYREDQSELRYYCPPADLSSCHHDLHEGIANFVRKDIRKGRDIDDLLVWISRDRSRLRDADIICRRGMLKKIMITPYQTKNKWQAAVTLFQGKFYISEIFDIPDEQWNASQHSEYSGFKFENCITAATPGGAAGSEDPVNSYKKFFSVVQRKLGSSHDLLFCAEIDCAEQNGAGKKSYIELTTSAKDLSWYRMLELWAQSYLGGVNKVICATKEDNHTIKNIVEYDPIEDIINQSGNLGQTWHPVCLDFLNKFLTEMKEMVKEDNQHMVYLFKYNGSGPIEYEETRPTDSKLHVLPKWYTDMF